MTEPFSKRFGYQNGKSSLIFEQAPEAIRIGLREILESCGYDGPSSQRGIICKALRKMPDGNNWSEYPNVDSEVNDLLFSLEWYKFYDLCEKLGRLIGELLEEKLNHLFQEENIGYEIHNNEISKIGSEEFRQAVGQATQLLTDIRFQAPLRQFAKALGFRNSLPPDHPNAVKEAVNSVEGVLQVVSQMPGTAMPTVISSLEPQLPSGLKKLYDGLYGYGSGSEGARHASVGGHTPSLEEAEFIIHTSAAAISYAIKKYG